MRISTSWSHQLGVNAMLDQQLKLSNTQMKLSTGKKILSPSEDTAATVRMMDLEQMTRQTEQYQANIGIARQRLSLEESNIQDVVNTMFRVKQLTVQGLNDTYSQSDRAAIAEELDQLNEHLLGIANSKNANGEYIFAGYASGTTPYAKGPDFDNSLLPGSAVASYPYFGDKSQRNIQIGPSRQVADGNYGEQVFGVSDVSSTDTAPLDPANAQLPKNLFELIGKLSASLKDNRPQDVSLTELDGALQRVVTIETTIGARMHVLDSQEGVNEDYMLDLQSATSDIGDLDYAEAISKFNLQQISLQAAQQAYTKVQNLSLFNYL